MLEVLSDQEKESEGIPDQVIVVRVASEKSPSGNYYVSFGGIVREIEEISGFEYEEGYEYHILILAGFHGQKADPRYTYTYHSTYSKEKKNSEWSKMDC